MSPSHPRKRRRVQVTPQFRLHRSPITNDPIATPFLTPGDRPHQQHTPLAQTPPPITPTPRRRITPQISRLHTAQKPRSETPVPQRAVGDPPQSQWSGGLFSGHKPLTCESLLPTPPSAGTDVCPLPSVRERTADARVRRLSFGVEQTPVREPRLSTAQLQPTDNHSGNNQKQARLQQSSPNAPRKRLRIHPTPHSNPVGDDTPREKSTNCVAEPLRYECSQLDDDDGNIADSVSPFPDTPPDSPPSHDIAFHTPASKPAEVEMRTPDDTVVRRCRAPRWDGPITQIPETPTEQLPPREAPIYVVKTATTAPVQLPSLRESLPSSPHSPDTKKKGFLWLDMGTDSRDGETTKIIDEDSESASTEPPSPVRKGDEQENVQCRAQIFCRSVRVSIPAGGFRSPSPEGTPPHS